MRITIKELREQINHVNDYVLENSIYFIKMQRHSGHYWLYLHTKDEIDRRVRTLWAGNAREINSYLVALQQKYWYMKEPF